MDHQKGGGTVKRILRELRHDLKEPGLNILALPIVSLLFLPLTCAVQDRLGDNNRVTPAILEVLIPFLGGYASLMLMQGLLDTEGCDTLFSYPRSNLYWGLIRQLRLFLVQAVHTVIVCLAVAIIVPQTSFPELFLLTLAQSFAVMAAAFCGVAVTRSVGMGLVILLAFIGIQITLGREYAVFNWLYVLTGHIPDNGTLVTICARSILIGAAGGFVGQLRVRP